MDELELAERVTAGAEFMDAIDAEWFWIIDVERLNMRRIWSWTRGACGCVLSQYDPTGEYNVNAFGLSARQDDDVRLGFDLSGWSYNPAGWEALTALWREAINERRAAWFDAHPEYVIA